MMVICFDCGASFEANRGPCPQCGSRSRRVEASDHFRIFQGTDLKKSDQSGTLIEEASSHEDPYRKGEITINWAVGPGSIQAQGRLSQPLEKGRDELRAAELLARGLNAALGGSYVAQKADSDPPDAWLEDQGLPPDNPDRRVSVEVRYLEDTVIASLGTTGQFQNPGDLVKLVEAVRNAVAAKKYDQTFARGTYLVLDAPHPISDSILRAIRESLVKDPSKGIFREVWIASLGRPAFRVM